MATSPSSRRTLWGVLILSGICLVAAALTLVSPSLSPLNDADLYQASLNEPDLSQFSSWYASSSMSTILPVPIRDKLQSLPPGQLIAADSGDSDQLGFAMFAPQYSLNHGGRVLISTDLDFYQQWAAATGAPPLAIPPTQLDQYAKLGYQPGDAVDRDIQLWQTYLAESDATARLLRDGRPIFNESESNDVTMKLLTAFHVNYILLEPAKHHRLKALVDSSPERFSLAVDASSRELYQVKTSGH